MIVESPTPTARQHPVIVRWLILVTALVLFCAACGSTSASKQFPGHYPHSAEDSFLTGCTNGSNGMLDVCNKTLACIEQHMTYTEYTAWSVNAVEGNAQPASTAHTMFTCICIAGKEAGLHPNTSSQAKACDGVLGTNRQATPPTS